MYLRARYLAPGLETFASRDPWRGSASAPRTWNGYAWVEGNVVNRVDPGGMAAGIAACESSAPSVEVSTRRAATGASSSVVGVAYLASPRPAAPSLDICMILAENARATAGAGIGSELISQIDGLKALGWLGIAVEGVELACALKQGDAGAVLRQGAEMLLGLTPTGLLLDVIRLFSGLNLRENNTPPHLPFEHNSRFMECSMKPGFRGARTYEALGEMWSWHCDGSNCHPVPEQAFIAMQEALPSFFVEDGRLGNLSRDQIRYLMDWLADHPQVKDAIRQEPWTSRSDRNDRLNATLTFLLAQHYLWGGTTDDLRNGAGWSDLSEEYFSLNYWEARRKPSGALYDPRPEVVFPGLLRDLESLTWVNPLLAMDCRFGYRPRD
ncbi:MAG: hypothetical protein IPM16_04760 [Chloroflexi bacterium]|nr:hypothetical protein [Chloroflexota bacterium]